MVDRGLSLLPNSFLPLLQTVFRFYLKTITTASTDDTDRRRGSVQLNYPNERVCCSEMIELSLTLCVCKFTCNPDVCVFVHVCVKKLVQLSLCYPFSPSPLSTFDTSPHSLSPPFISRVYSLFYYSADILFQRDLHLCKQRNKVTAQGANIKRQLQ